MSLTLFRFLHFSEHMSFCFEIDNMFTLNDSCGLFWFVDCDVISWMAKVVELPRAWLYWWLSSLLLPVLTLECFTSFVWKFFTIIFCILSKWNKMRRGKYKKEGWWFCLKWNIIFTNLARDYQSHSSLSDFHMLMSK